MKVPLNAVDFDPVRTDAWLRSPSGEHPGWTNAEALGIDPEDFRRDTDGFLSTIDDLLAAGPYGLLLRVDVDRIELWGIPDGDVLDCGALITVDLTNGVRLASLHQDLTDFADRGARGFPAALSALEHIARQASALVETYQRSNPTYQPPAQHTDAEGVPS